MARKIFGPVRQAAYDAAKAAEVAATETANQAQKNMFTVTAKVMTILEKACAVLDDIEDGTVKVKLFGKELPIEFNWNIKE